MPATFRVGLPTVHQRRDILTTILKMEQVPLVLHACCSPWVSSFDILIMKGWVTIITSQHKLDPSLLFGHYKGLT